MVIATLFAAFMAIPQLIAKVYSIDDIPAVQLVDSTRHVVNPDGILSLQTQTQVDRIIAQIRRTTTAEISVVVVDDVDSDPDEFATDLFSKWQIGKSDRDNGLLILVAKEQHAIVIRTGYGLEGILPDILAGRIIRDTAIPYFRQEDYDGGIVATISTVSDLLTNPDAADEIRSKYLSEGDNDSDDVFKLYLQLCVILAIGSFAYAVYVVIRNRKRTPADKYSHLDNAVLPLLMITVFGIGIPILGLLILLIALRRVRNRKHICPQCGARMQKLSKQRALEYLAPGQLIEQRLESVDHDVWICPACNTTEVESYVRRSTPYQVCPKCGVRAYIRTGDRVIVQPTVKSPGKGVRIYTCRACGHHGEEPYEIAPRQDLTGPIIIGGLGALSGRGGGGGGFSGGSFGGGMTGGGGASGRW